MKAKKCKSCGKEYQPFRPLQRVCSPMCAINLTRTEKKKAFNRETLKMKTRIKTRAQWEAGCQKAVNRYIRARDNNKPCISCGTERQDIQYAAGHYLTRGGHSELRYDEDNIHKQCNKHCNLELSGNIAAYRINLIKRIGLVRVEWLEGPHNARKDTIEDLKERTDKYNKMALALEKEL